MVAVEDSSGIGTYGSSAVKVVDGVERDSQTGDEVCDAVEPEGDVASGPVDEKNGREGTGARGLDGVKADCRTAAVEGEHGDEMRLWTV